MKKAKPGIEKDFDWSRLQALEDRLTAIAGKQVVVGIPAAANQTSDSGTTLAVIAATHEFGSPKAGIPERAPLRSSMVANQQRYVRLQESSLKAVMSGQMTMDQAMEKLGMAAAADAQAHIAEGEFTPLKPATIRRKGSDKPLIDTGQFRQSITHEVRDA